jgi:hypothetical protein
MDTLLLVDYDITVQYYLYRYRATNTYIDQCKDTYCKGREWYHAYRYKLKERMPNIAGIWRIVRKRNRVQCRVGVECFPQLAVVPLFREQYRLVDNSILLLVCLGRSVEYAGHSVCIVRNVKK